MAQANLGGTAACSRASRSRARELLEAAAASGNPQVVPLAQANLGGLLADAGRAGAGPGTAGGRGRVRGPGGRCRRPRICSGTCWLVRKTGPARRPPTRRPSTPGIRTGRRSPSSTWRPCASGRATRPAPGSCWRPRPRPGTREVVPGAGSARGPAGWSGGLGRRGGRLPGGHRHRGSALGAGRPAGPGGCAPAAGRHGRSPGPAGGRGRVREPAGGAAGPGQPGRPAR